MYIARDKSGELHLFIYNRPIRNEIEGMEFWINLYNNNDRTLLPQNLFPELTWEDEAREISITLL